MQSEFSIVIVNFNADAHLAGLLASVAEELRDVQWDGVVVDNGSHTDIGSLVSRFPQVTLRRTQGNLGFARAANMGVAETRGPLLLIVNPDCLLRPGAVATMAQELARYRECGIVGPCVLDEDGGVQGSARGDPGIMTGLFGRSTILSRLFPMSRLSRHNVRSEAAVASGLSSVAVDWVAGSCLLVRREVFRKVAGFDEAYFLYWEDADLCRRIRGAGFSVRYVPGARVVHAGGQSSRTARALAIRAFHRSAYTYYCRHVATSPLHPGRAVARVVLTLRCWWKLLAASSQHRA